jgi:hypothetical protein
MPALKQTIMTAAASRERFLLNDFIAAFFSCFSIAQSEQLDENTAAASNGKVARLCHQIGSPTNVVGRLQRIG